MSLPAPDVVRAALEAVCRVLIEGEVSELAGAELGERRPEDRMTHRRRLSGARVADAGGDGRAADPEAAPGQLLPSFLEPRRRSEQACLPLSRPMSVASPRAVVDQLVESLGLRVSRSEMSRSCAPRRARGGLPDATVGGHLPLPVPSTSRSRGARRRPGGPKGAGDRAWRPRDRREILGLDVGEAESEALWTEFLRSRVARGLIGVSSPSATRTPG
jgi:putative transposase